MNNKILNLSEKLNSKFFFNHNIGKLTWFRTGGNAKIFVIVENNKELEIILNEINNDDYYILGAGSNLLVRDNGYNGIIIKLGKEFNFCKINEDKLEVGSSTQDINLSNFALKNSIQGFEFFSGIPGSVGGAIKMNAGCFGSETKDVIENIEIYNEAHEKKILKKNDINLAYRMSNIRNNQTIVKATFKINYGNVDEIKDKMKNIKIKRLSSQPIKNRTSGSTFKNPSNQYAAKLIEKAGCKGMNCGNAIVSNHHSNFIINTGNATASDIENLGKLIIDKVYNKFEVKLDWEVKIIGEQ
tara:strand:- start:158 stop:1054 length:897 start_codon:yes stop_codon:yes gene_type:complete